MCARKRTAQSSDHGHRLVENGRSKERAIFLFTFFIARILPPCRLSPVHSVRIEAILVLLTETAAQPALSLLLLRSSCGRQLSRRRRSIARVSERDRSAFRCLHRRCSAPHRISALFWNRSLEAIGAISILRVPVLLISILSVLFRWRRNSVYGAVLAAWVGTIRPWTSAVRAGVVRWLVPMLRILSLPAVHHGFRSHPIRWQAAGPASHALCSRVTAIVSTTISIGVSVVVWTSVVACGQAVGKG